MMLGNGTTRKCGYDARSQLTTQIELSGGAPICTIVDGYDPVGNRITRNLDGNPITWSYDDLYRLTGQQKAGQVCTYTLDGVGNLKTMWEGGSFPKTFTFNAADRLVTMVEGANLTTYAYTGYGALESEITGNQTTSYAYNGQDQLVLVTPPSGFPSTYSFDGDGLRRTAQEANAQPTTMVWDGSDYLLLRGPSSDQVVLTLDSEIVHCGGKDLLTDPLGSLVKEITAGAGLSPLFEFNPYGTVAVAGSRTTNPFQFVAAYGYYTDTSDRDHIRARELYKRLGRWMQTDPLWPEELAFVYVEGHPLSSSDPMGLQLQSWEIQNQQWKDYVQGWNRYIHNLEESLRCYDPPWPDLVDKYPCKQPKAGFTSLPPGKACDIYLKTCKQGWVLACNMYYVCMGAGPPGILPGIGGRGANCVRGCLLSVFGPASLRSCTCSCLQHKACFALCKWSPPWPFNQDTWRFVCKHIAWGAPSAGDPVKESPWR